MDAFGFGIISQEPEPLPIERQYSEDEDEPEMEDLPYKQEPISRINENKEIDLDDFSDEQFEHQCPYCGFRYNDL